MVDIAFSSSLFAPSSARLVESLSCTETRPPFASFCTASIFFCIATAIGAWSFVTWSSGEMERRLQHLQLLRGAGLHEVLLERRLERAHCFVWSGVRILVTPASNSDLIAPYSLTKPILSGSSDASSS